MGEEGPLTRESRGLSPIVDTLFKCSRTSCLVVKIWGNQEKIWRPGRGTGTLVGELWLPWYSRYDIDILSAQNNPMIQKGRKSSKNRGHRSQLEGVTAGQIWNNLSITTQSYSNASHMLIQTNKLGRENVSLKLQSQLMNDGNRTLPSATLTIGLSIYWFAC